MDSLLVLDHQLFFFLRDLPHGVFTNTFALWLSGIGAGGLIWLFLSIWLFVREEKRDHWFFLPVVSATALSLFITEFFLKNFFARNRPPGSNMGDYSFPSGHATFAWALAVVLAAKEPRARYFFYALAILISFSRIYLGVHYPADIVAGSMVGLYIGFLSLWIESCVHVDMKRTK